MATLHVRNVPDELMEQVRERARAENRSVSAEVVVLLQWGLGEPRMPVAQLLAEINRRREQQPLRPDIPDSVQLLREDRDR